MKQKPWIACAVIISLATALFGASTFFPDFYRSFNPKKGGWASYRLTDAMGETSTLTFAVVAEEAASVWLEVRSEQGGVEGIAAYLLRGDPSKDENVLKLRVQSEPGKVLEFDQETLLKLKKMDPAAFGGTTAVPIGPTMGKIQGLPDETLQVGKKKLKCRHLKVVGPDKEAEVWVSDKVTPFGIVRLVSGSEEVLLLEYGKGAKPKVQGIVTPFVLP